MMSEQSILTKPKKQVKLTKNIVISITAQLVSLLVGFVINLIVPKFIGEYDYAHWQSYVLYVGYVGIMHFGLLDGIVLKYSQYDYDEIDKARLRSQFKVLLVLNSIISIVSIFLLSIILDFPFKLVFIFVAIGITTKNIVTYSSYTFQITNRINKYAILTISHKGFYGLLVVAFLLFGCENFFWFCLADVLGDLLCFILCVFFNRGMYLGKSLPIKDTIKEAKENISSGVLLLIANWSVLLIVGMAKTAVQMRWGTMVFGKVSFAFSVSGLFLTFVTAISVVLFPTLKRMDQNELPSLYKKIRNLISPLLLGALILYFPGCIILKLWIPKYTESLQYLGIILPVIVYSSKMSLLTNTYLKSYRKEKLMFIINVLSAVLGIGLFFSFAYLFNNLFMVMLSMVCTVMFNSIASEIVVFKIIKNSATKDFIIEVLCTLSFIFFVHYLDFLIAFILYVCVFIIYCFINDSIREKIMKVVLRRKL